MQHVTARVALMISALIATGVAASAADNLPPPPPGPVFTWTGFYIGVNGGYGNAAFEDATVTTSDGTISRGGGGQAKGGIVGGQIGVNYQVGAGVFLPAPANGSKLRPMVGAVVHKFQHLLWGYLHAHGNGKSQLLRNPSRPRWPRD